MYPWSALVELLVASGPWSCPHCAEGCVAEAPEQVPDMMMSLTSCLCAQANDCMTFLIWDLSCYLCRQFQQQLGPGCSGVSNTASLVLCAIPMSNSFVQQFILDASPSYSSFFFLISSVWEVTPLSLLPLLQEHWQKLLKCFSLPSAWEQSIGRMLGLLGRKIVMTLRMARESGIRYM